MVNQPLAALQLPFAFQERLRVAGCITIKDVLLDAPELSEAETSILERHLSRLYAGFQPADQRSSAERLLKEAAELQAKAKAIQAKEVEGRIKVERIRTVLQYNRAGEALIIVLKNR